MNKFHKLELDKKTDIMNIIASNDFYEISIEDELSILEIKDKVFDLITDINLSGKLIEFLNGIDHNPDIKGLILFNDPEALTRNNMKNLLPVFLILHRTENLRVILSFKEKNARFREINILKYIDSKYGKITNPGVCRTQWNRSYAIYWNSAMVADFRYASDDAVLSMIHNKYGLHPSGGFPFFFLICLIIQKPWKFKCQIGLMPRKHLN